MCQKILTCHISSASLYILIFGTKCPDDIFHKYIQPIFLRVLEIQCRVLDNTIKDTIKKAIKFMAEGDLVPNEPDLAEFPESAPGTRNFYSDSVLHLGSGIFS